MVFLVNRHLQRDQCNLITERIDFCEAVLFIESKTQHGQCKPIPKQVTWLFLVDQQHLQHHQFNQIPEITDSLEAVYPTV